jgi:hypothetical protein
MECHIRGFRRLGCLVHVDTVKDREKCLLSLFHPEFGHGQKAIGGEKKD